MAKMTNHIEAKEGIWLGGSLEDNLWQWVTGEPWKTAIWADASAATKEGAALALRPRDGWLAKDRGDTTDGFLIEWSEDEKAPKPGSAPPAGNSKVAELDAKLKELIRAASKKREAEHASNIKSLQWDLDAYLRKLTSSGKDQFGFSVNAIKEMVDDNRLEVEKLKDMSESGDIIASVEMIKIVNYYCDKQVRIDAQADAGIEKIRDAYVTKLTAIKEEAKAAGQMKLATDLEEIIEDAEDLDSWAKSFDTVEE